MGEWVVVTVNGATAGYRFTDYNYQLEVYGPSTPISKGTAFKVKIAGIVQPQHEGTLGKLFMAIVG